MFRRSAKKRKQYFIKKAFQMKVIVQFLLILFIGIIISGVCIYFLADNELQTQLFTAHLTIENTRDLLLPIIIFTSLIVLTLLSTLTVYTVLYLSHKIAGPLYRFEKITEDIGKGDLNTYVKLRKNDELLPLQTAFENMVENLKNKIMNFKNNFKKFQEIEKKLDNAIQTSTLSEVDKKSLASAVKEFTTEYEENVNAFMIKDK